MSDPIRINGNEYSWGSITLKIDGDVFYGFTEITWGHARNRSKTYGMGRHHAPRGRTRGKYEPDVVKLKGPIDSWQAVRAKLAAASPSGKTYGDTEFGIFVEYLEGDRQHTLEFERCVYAKESGSHSEGPDALQEEVEIDTMLIRVDGLALWDEE